MEVLGAAGMCGGRNGHKEGTGATGGWRGQTGGIDLGLGGSSESSHRKMGAGKALQRTFQATSVVRLTVIL